MKIESYDLSMASTRAFAQKDQETEEMREWGKQKNPQVNPNQDLKTGHNHAGSDRVRISDEARRSGQIPYKGGKSVDTNSNTQEMSSEEEDSIDSRMMTLKRMIESFTGREIKLARVSNGHSSGGGNYSDPNTGTSQPAPSNQTDQAPTEQQWGMSYTYSKTHYESEQTSFSAAGTVNTADGKSISFSMNLQMSREYFSEEKLSVTAGAPKIDPLVINYSGSAAELQNTTFEFDLNSDGTKDQISQLAPGSGFLVFDKNNDGVINNGSELFGPTTGNGFAELAAYDQDKNNWIDENDSIFTKLSLWQKGNETDQLLNLKQANVGAIYLGNASTSFDLKNTSNDTLGQIQKTGVYLKETGGAGTVQQIDFTA